VKDGEKVLDKVVFDEGEKVLEKVRFDESDIELVQDIE